MNANSPRTVQGSILGAATLLGIALASATLAQRDSTFAQAPFAQAPFAQAPLAQAPDALPVIERFDLGVTDDYADYGGLLFSPRGIALTAGGDILVADSGNNRIQRFTQEGDLIGLWGGRGAAEGRFETPFAVAVAPGPQGAIYVADTGNHRVQSFAPDGTIALPPAWGGQGQSAGQFDSPQGVAVGPDGTVYVADTGNSRVQAFTPEGVFVREWGGLGTADEELDQPSGIAVSADGTVFVADTGNRRVKLFNAAGDLLSVWTADVGEPGSISLALQHVWVVDRETGVVRIFTTVGLESGRAELGDAALAVAADASGGAYVTDASSIHHVGADGEIISTVRSAEDHPWVFPFASGLASAPDDSLYVAMAGFDEIRHFDRSGQVLGRLKGTWSDESTGCLGPGAIEVAFDGTLNVVDVCAGEIERYRPDGTSLGVWSAQGVGQGQYRTANGLAIAPDGSFFIADATMNRVLAYDAAGEFVTAFGSEGSASGEFRFPSPEQIPPLREVGMAIDSGGRLVVADAGNKRLQRFGVDGSFQRSSSTEIEQLDPELPVSGIPGDLTSIGLDLVASDPQGALVMRFRGGGDASDAIGDRCAMLAGGELVCHPHGREDASEFLGTVAGVAALSDGTIAVLDFEKVMVYTLDGLLVRRFGLYGTGIGAFAVPPGGLGATGDGGVAVVDADRQRLVSFDMEGAYAWALPHSLAAAEVVSGTRSVVPFTDLRGADGALRRNVVADNAPASARGFGGPTDPFQWLVAPGEAVGVVGARKRPDNTNYVLMDDESGARVLRRTDDAGTALGDIPLADGTGPFDVDRNGTTYVIAAGGETVEVRRTDVPGVIVWGPGGNVLADFGQLTDITVGENDDVILVDRAAGHLERRTADGVLLGSWDGGASPFSELTSAWWAPDGGLWVADRDGARIRVFDQERRAGWRAEYFADEWLTGHFVGAEVMTEPRHNWGSQAPANGVGADDWSARITRDLDLAAGEHHFEVVASGGIRLWVDDQLLADFWSAASAFGEADVTLARGLHRVTLEFRDAGGASSFEMVVPEEVAVPTATPTGVPSPTPTRPAVFPRQTPTPVRPGTSTDVKRLVLPVQDLLYTPLTHRLVATLPELEAEAGTALVEIDPERATQLVSTGFRETLGALGGASDGSRVYLGLPDTGRVLAYDPLAASPDFAFQVGETGVMPADLAVDPVDPARVAATLVRSNGRVGVALFEDGVRRPQLTGAEAPSDVIAFASSGDVVFAHQNDIAGPIHQLAASRSGVTVTRTVPGLASAPGADIQYAGGRLYLSSFDVVDAASMTRVAQIQGASGRVLVADVGTGKAYAAWSGAIHVYALDTLEETDVIAVTGMATDPVKMVRWGADGLAMIDGTRLWIVRDARIAAPTLCCRGLLLPALLTQN